MPWQSSHRCRSMILRKSILSRDIFRLCSSQAATVTSPPLQSRAYSRHYGNRFQKANAQECDPTHLTARKLMASIADTEATTLWQLGSNEVRWAWNLECKQNEQHHRRTYIKTKLHNSCYFFSFLFVFFTARNRFSYTNVMLPLFASHWTETNFDTTIPTIFT